jgi:hypothetical protein
MIDIIWRIGLVIIGILLSLSILVWTASRFGFGLKLSLNTTLAKKIRPTKVKPIKKTMPSSKRTVNKVRKESLFPLK